MFIRECIEIVFVRMHIPRYTPTTHHVTCHAHHKLRSSYMHHHGVAECPTLVWWISAPSSDSSVAVSDCIHLPRAQEMCSHP